MVNILQNINKRHTGKLYKDIVHERERKVPNNRKQVHHTNVCHILNITRSFQKESSYLSEKSILLKSTTHLVFYIQTSNITGFVNSYSNCFVEEKVNARKQNGDEFSRKYVTPLEVRSWIIVWKVETDVNLPPISVLKYTKRNCIHKHTDDFMVYLSQYKKV